MIIIIRFLYFFTLLCLFSCCNLRGDKVVAKTYGTNIISCNDVDRENLIWFFYSYSHGCDVLFRNENENISFKAEECSIELECERLSADTILVKCIFMKDTLIGIKQYNCLAIDKAFYFNGLFKPLTQSMVIDAFQDTNLLAKDNIETLQRFKNYLKLTDTGTLSSWLKNEIYNNRLILK